MSLSFQVRKAHLPATRWVRVPKVTDLAPGQVLVSVEKFALTSNNITYARLGDRIPYWRYFPAEGGWGRIPVWGVGRVCRSRQPSITEGEQVYGFFPMDAETILQPGDPTGARIVEHSPHRLELPPTYNEYLLIDRDKTYDRAHVDAHLVLRPLFSLSFFCATFLKEKEYFGVGTIILTSASSKAAQGMAMMLARLGGRGHRLKVFGLTSKGHVQFLARRGLYDQVFAYTDISQLPLSPSVLVDIGGDAGHRAEIHRRLNGALKYSALAGFTHWDVLADPHSKLPGAKPELFSRRATSCGLGRNGEPNFCGSASMKAGARSSPTLVRGSSTSTP
jgi:hypothetical protein